MEKEVLCILCRKPMREIGSFASLKPEGEPAEKDDSKLKFQCLDENCNKYREIIEIKISNLESYTTTIQKLCQCKHTREMHDYRFPVIEDGEPIKKTKKDINCKVNDCNCVEYFAQSF